MVIGMKNKSLKYGCDIYFSSLGLKYLFFIYCLMLLPFDLLIFVTGTACANSEKLVEYELPQDNTSDSNDSSDQLKRQLWLSDITPAKDEKGMNTSMELSRLIQQIRAIEFTPQEKTPTPVFVPDTVTTTEPNEAAPVTAIPIKKEKTELEPKLPYLPISDKTLQMLRKLSNNPVKIDNPFELSEILFISGNLGEAATFYQEALNRTDQNDPNSAMDRAWFLFQKGNCLRNNDRITAANLYRQLITEYPGSLWAEVAQIQSQFITWCQKDEPQKLIDENKQQKIGIK